MARFLFVGFVLLFQTLNWTCIWMDQILAALYLFVVHCWARCFYNNPLYSGGIWNRLYCAHEVMKWNNRASILSFCIHCNWAPLSLFRSPSCSLVLLFSRSFALPLSSIRLLCSSQKVYLIEWRFRSWLSLWNFSWMRHFPFSTNNRPPRYGQ